MSGESLDYTKLSEVDITSELQNSDYVLVVKQNTNSGDLECKKIALSQLGGLIEGGGGGATLYRSTNVLPSLPAGTNRGTFTLGSSAILLKIETTESARVRLYPNYTDSENDLTRPPATAVDESVGLLAEFNSDVSHLIKRYTPGVIVYNDENPLNNFVYYTIECSTITDVFFTYIRLENVGAF